MNTGANAMESLAGRFLQEFPEDAARRIAGLPEQEIAEILSAQPVQVLSRLWPHLLPEQADALIPLLDAPLLSRLLYEMDPPDCIAILNRLGKEERTRCLNLLPHGYRTELEKLMEYPVGSAGRIMDTRMLLFQPNDTIAETLTRLRKHHDRATHQLLLVDSGHRLQGTVDIRDVALADPETKLGSLPRPQGISVSPFDSREEVADLIRKFNLEQLPVVGIDGRLLGVIRYAALIRTLEEQSAADIQTMVGVSKDERALSPVAFAVRRRLPWMEINLATAFLAAAVVGLFESTIAQFTALAVLLPVVAGQSGNAGAQAQAVTIRGLALREVTIRNWFRLMMKEINVGMLNGLAIAATTAVGVYIWSRSAGLSLVIGLSMVISMVAAGIAGSVIPIALTRFGQDPAQSSSIVLTTITDVTGFMSFLGIATLLSRLL